MAVFLCNCFYDLHWTSCMLRLLAWMKSENRGSSGRIHAACGLTTTWFRVLHFHCNVALDLVVFLNYIHYYSSALAEESKYYYV